MFGFDAEMRKKNLKKEKFGFNSKRYLGLKSVRDYANEMPLTGKHMNEFKLNS